MVLKRELLKNAILQNIFGMKKLVDMKIAEVRSKNLKLFMKIK